MKFSFRQILASAGGGVLAAVLASLFGVKGTIVGVAIGSAAATFGTAFLAQSIDRGHQAVKQVVVRAPDTSTLLRRLGATGAAGVATSGPADTSVLAEKSTSSAVTPEETIAVPVPGDDVEPTQPVAVAGDPVEPTQPAPVAGGAADAGTAAPAGAPHRTFRWPAIAGTAAIVFVLSLGFVTAIELIAGRPLSDLLGGHTKGGATTFQQIIQSPPATTTTTSSTTTTTTTTSTTTTTVPGSTTSTVPGTSTSSPSTTTTGVDSSTSTTATTVPG